MTDLTTHEQTAYRLYQSFQAMMQHPTRAWDDLLPEHRDRLIKRARVFSNLGHLPLAERLYASWWHAYPVKSYGRCKPGIWWIWEQVAGEYRALEWLEQAA